jgi:chloramphenicol 3-O-phosphotransferase
MIIIITGTSSAGKSSVCQLLRNRLGDGWLGFSTDDYLAMLGDKFLGLHPNNPDLQTPNDICYATKHDDSTYEIIPGKLCSKLYATIPDTLENLARQGFNIVVDSFITTHDEFLAYKNI